MVQLAERMIGRFDDRRRGFVTDAQRTGMESDINPAYDLLIPALWELGRSPEAMERAEQAHARVLLDLVASRHAARSREARVALDLLQQREELASKLAAIESELSGDPAAERRRQLLRERAVLDAEAERLGFESLLSAKSPLATGEPLDVARIGSTANEVGPILLYYVAAEETFVFLLRADADPAAEVLSPGANSAAGQGKWPTWPTPTTSTAPKNGYGPCGPISSDPWPIACRPAVRSP